MLTGNIRYRIGFRRKLVLQVEHEIPKETWMPGPVPRVWWADATVQDMQTLGSVSAKPDGQTPPMRNPTPC
jgi:hypothetical protein